MQLLDRLSDAGELVCDASTHQELATALVATRNAINGIKFVVRTEVVRHGL